LKKTQKQKRIIIKKHVKPKKRGKKKTNVGKKKKYKIEKMNRKKTKTNEKKHVGKHCSKIKIMWGNIVTIHSILKKKLRSKIDKDHFERKKSHVGKHYNNP